MGIAYRVFKRLVYTLDGRRLTMRGEEVTPEQVMRDLDLDASFASCPTFCLYQHGTLRLRVFYHRKGEQKHAFFPMDDNYEYELSKGNNHG